MPRTSEPGRSVSSRLLQVLFAFSRSGSKLTLADLVRETGMPHATVRRFAIELAEAGALDRQPDGSFTIGIKLWRLGTLAPLTEPLRTAAQPVIESLYAAVRQHVQIAVLEDRSAVIIERWSAPNALGLATGVGGRLPLHCSAVGKVLLSHASTDLLDEVLGSHLTAYTRRTTTDSLALRKELAECRRSGTATVCGELTADADSFATRIVGGDGRVVAALSVVVRAGSVEQHAALPAVVASGFHLSRMLGWNPRTRVRIG